MSPRFSALLLLASLLFARAEAQEAPAPTPEPFRFAHENILGTSLDLKVRSANAEVAAAVEKAVLAEIERACKIFNTYDPTSEISKINAQAFRPGETISISMELFQLLQEANKIQQNSGGAFNAYLGVVLDLWREADKKGDTPKREALESALAQAKTGYKVQRNRQQTTLTRLAPGRFHLDAIAKGFIMDGAAAAGMKVSGCQSLMLDIGGEIVVAGEPWNLGIANPKRTEDNAPPLTQVTIKNLAMATSGDYARSIKVGERKRNHIIDARTGRPATGVVSATVIGGRASEADALATALCVLPPAKGIELVERYSGAVCLLVESSGKTHRSRGFSTFEKTLPKIAGKEEPKETAWPKDYRAVLTFTLRDSTGGPAGKFKRHFVGAWVEDSAGRRVRILAVWAELKEIKYLRDLNEFWKYAWVLPGGGDNPQALASISRATRPPGEYKLLWDGLDDAGKPLPQGKYLIKVDVNREHGPPSGREIHTAAEIPINCLTRPASAKAKDQPELSGVSVKYGP